MSTGDRFPTFRATAALIRRLWRWTRPFLAVTAGLLLLAYVITNAAAGRALERELALARSRQEPLTLAEAAPPPVPDEENAALLYTQAFHRLPRLEIDPRSGERRDQRLARADDQVLSNLLSEYCSVPFLSEKQAMVTLQQVRRAVDGTEGDLKLARRAAAMPRCRFAVEWEAGWEALLPHVVQLRSLARLLGGHALIAAADGDSAGALADLKAMVGIARHVGSEPTLIGQATQYACLAMMVNGLRQVMPLTSFSEAQSREYSQLLAQVDLHTPFERALYTERALGLWTFDLARRDPERLLKLAGDNAGFLGEIAVFLRPVAEPLLKQDELLYLRMMAQQIERARQRHRLPAASPSPVELRLPWYARITALILPAVEGVSTRRDERIAGLALARTALALHVYHQRTGQYPGSLEQTEALLGWRLPADPFSGGDLMYRREGDGYLLYSLGVNSRDDGGKDNRRKQSVTRLKDDIPWHVAG